MSPPFELPAPTRNVPSDQASPDQARMNATGGAAHQSTRERKPPRTSGVAAAAKSPAGGGFRYAANSIFAIAQGATPSAARVRKLRTLGSSQWSRSSLGGPLAVMVFFSGSRKMLLSPIANMLASSWVTTTIVARRLSLSSRDPRRWPAQAPPASACRRLSRKGKNPRSP